MPASVAIATYFSPSGGCAAALSALLTSAASAVRLAMYDFTNLALAAQVLAARSRGCSVEVIVDRSSQRRPSSAAYYLASHGVPVVVPAVAQVMHDKFLIVDSLWTATGSYNWTATAETGNYENLIFVQDPTTAAAYLANFVSIFNACSAYRRMF